MRTKKRRKSLDERLLEARASVGASRTDPKRPTADPPVEEAYEPITAWVEPPETTAFAAEVEAPVAFEIPAPAPPAEPLAYELDAPADEPVEDPTPRFDTAEQGVDDVARAVAALSASEGDTFLPSGAAAAPVPISSPARPANPEPQTNSTLSRPDDAASPSDDSAQLLAELAEATNPEPAAEDAPEHGLEPNASDAPTAAGSELPSGLMDRWTLTTRRARKATSVAPPTPAPTAAPDPGPTVAAPEERSTAILTIPRAEVADNPMSIPSPMPPVAPEPVAEEAVESEVADAREPSRETERLDGDDQQPQQYPRGGQFARVGSTMIERGLISDEQLSRALESQRSSGRRVGEILVELGALTSVDLARVLADHFGVPFTDLRTQPPDPVLSRFLPEEVARRYDALAIARSNDQLVIAMANPTDLFALDDLQLVTRQPVMATMAVKEDLRAAIDRVYRGSTVETNLDAAASDYKSADAEIAASQVAEVNEGPIVGLVSALMSQAITDHASDLHIEPCSTHVAVRFRIDGVLHDSSEVPLELLRPLVSRLKIMAGLDIAQNRVAQDGRFSLSIHGRSVDVRVVTMPTAAGESVILRLLDPVRDALGVSSLGLSPAELARFVPAFQGSQGAVFIVGPTGSGKTSTVYAVLSEINTRSKSIISVEDPVEFRLDGVKQMQVNARVGLTFATTLPSVLRADPDIVFIGEVRDSETARIAADASITGHLVLSTIHATRAAATPMRLIEMGVEPYLVASALTLVASQRLARKLCEHCAEAHDASGLTLLRELGADEALLDEAKIRRAVGCPACRNTGYRGRLPIFEIMPITERISRLILDRAPRLEIERLAVEEGMDTLDRAALRRVAHGELSIEEMVRIIS